jgi:hypothetical protein
MEVTLMRATGWLIAAVTLVLCGTGAAGCGTQQRLRYGGSAVDQLYWMTGAWVAENEGVRTEEHWTAPRAGTMFAVGRTIEDEKTLFYEYLRIEASGDSAIYYASPRGRGTTPFKMTDVSDRRVIFENPQHDFPQRITYWRDEKNQLHAQIEGTQRGEPALESWSFQRIR